MNLYLSQPNFVETTLKNSGQHNEQLTHIQEYLVKDKPLSFEECVKWARFKFENDYGYEIKQLLFSMPKDAVSELQVIPASVSTAHCCSSSRSLPLEPFSGLDLNEHLTRLCSTLKMQVFRPFK